ncbi:MAG: YigZ family protein [Firmicutes bacterium]|nr:YigZ family protein [Bacillota bacterium]HXL03650.1 YigZ family protein [Bacillota bacterium]
MKVFFSVAKKSQYEQKIQRSVFIGHASPAADEEEAKQFIAYVREEHAEATHNCYAYRVGLCENPLTYYNDHGEPSGTAGRPILSAILKADVTNTVVVVTRYYGGRKLGVRGLIDAYHTTAAITLEQAGRIEVIPRVPLAIVCEYSELDQVNYLLSQYDTVINNTDYKDNVFHELLVPESDYAAIIAQLSAIPGVECKGHVSSS